MGFPGGAEGKENLPCNVRDPGLIPGWGRSVGDGHGNPFSILVWRTPWTEKPDRL